MDGGAHIKYVLGNGSRKSCQQTLADATKYVDCKSVEICRHPKVLDAFTISSSLFRYRSQASLQLVFLMPLYRPLTQNGLILSRKVCETANKKTECYKFDVLTLHTKDNCSQANNSRFLLKIKMISCQV